MVRSFVRYHENLRIKLKLRRARTAAMAFVR